MLDIDIYRIYSLIVLIVSLLLCLTVIYISHLLHKKKTNNYSWIIGFNTSVDLTYALINCICMSSSAVRFPHIHLMVHNPLFEYSNPTVIRLIVVFRLYITFIDSPLIGIHFWYRYNAVCKQKIWTWKTYLKVYVIFVSLSTLHLGSMYYNAIEDTIPTESIQQDDRLNARHVTFKVTAVRSVVLIYLQLLATFHYILIIYFGYHIYRVVRIQSLRTINTTQNAQKTLVHVMILQALYPLLVFLLPALVSLFCITVNIQLGSMALIMAAPLHLTPILSAFTVLTMMPSYRRTLNKILPTNNKITPLQNESSHINSMSLAERLRILFIRHHEPTHMITSQVVSQ